MSASEPAVLASTRRAGSRRRWFTGIARAAAAREDRDEGERAVERPGVPELGDDQREAVQSRRRSCWLSAALLPRETRNKGFDRFSHDAHCLRIRDAAGFIEIPGREGKRSLKDDFAPITLSVGTRAARAYSAPLADAMRSATGLSVSSPLETIQSRASLNAPGTPWAYSGQQMRTPSAVARQVAKLCDRRRSNGTLGVEVGAEVGQSGYLRVVEGEPRSLGGNFLRRPGGGERSTIRLGGFLIGRGCACSSVGRDHTRRAPAR